MKLIKRNSDDVVLFIGSDLQLDANEARGRDWRAAFINTEIGTLVAGVVPPAAWVGGAYTYVNGVWAVVPSEQARVDAVVAAQAAEAESHDLKTDADTAIKFNADAAVRNYVAQVQAGKWAAFTADWASRQAGFKDKVLMYIAWVVIKRLINKE